MHGVNPSVYVDEKISEDFEFRVPSDIEDLSPLDVMFLIFPLSMWKDIVRWTNKAYHLKNPNPPKNWKDFTLNELMKWHGLIIAMTLQKIPTTYRKYWEPDNADAWSSEAVRPPEFGRFMACPRWEAIKKYMHYNDPRGNLARTDPAHDPLYHLKPVLDVVNAAFKKHGKLGRYTCVDEAMVSAKVKSFFIRTVKGKPDPTGFKFWALCSSTNGWAYDIRLDMGGGPARYKAANNLPQSHKMTEGEAVVLGFSELLKPGQHTFTDRLFTSVRLAEKLFEKGIYLTGPCKKNVAGLPSEMLFMTKSRKHPRGSYIVVADRENPRLLAFSWHDNGIVYGVTTGFEPFGGEVERKLKSGEFVFVPCPPCMVWYNPNMGGVDTIDRIRGGKYHISKSVITRKWHVKLWTGIFGFGLANVWLLYRDCVVRAETDDDEKKKQENHYDFLRLLSKQMLNFDEFNIDDSPTEGLRPSRDSRHRLVHGSKRGRCAATRNCLEGVRKNGKVKNSKYYCPACSETYHPCCFFDMKIHGGYSPLPTRKGKV